MAFLTIISLHDVLADEGVHILQTYVTEQTMAVFTDAKLHSEKLNCTVSNQSAEIICSGLLSDDVVIKTTVLIDISTSMPGSMRSEVIAAIRNIIEQKSENEEFKLVTFGDKMNTLQDFSSDRYDLAQASEKIKFDGEQSKIYDAIYNTIPNISLTDDKLTFYRTIVITDGADAAASGITKEELFIKLQNEHYPVDVVAVSDSEGKENKELSAIVRMSSGRYYSLIPGADIASLAQGLGVNGCFYIKVKIPDNLLDGTTRQVDIGDCTYNMSMDIKFPIFNSAESEQEAISPSDLESNGVIFGDYKIVVLVVGIIFTICIGAKFSRDKKKKESHQNDNIAIEDRIDTNAYNTEYINPLKPQYTIKISSADEPDKTWTLPVNEGILIGRADHCRIRLEDKSVSREHCKIIVQSLGLCVVHLSSTNKTTINGNDVVGNILLKSGDILKIGREVLHIDYIQALGSQTPRQEQMKKNSGSTESIFRGEGYDS